MQLFYRISDKSYPKQKLIGATKQSCLDNFCEAFKEIIGNNCNDHKAAPMTIIADNCGKETTQMVYETCIPVLVTEDGNAGALRTAISMALRLPDEELVYFCEDDYLHLPTAPKLLEEGIKRADYVTLYDHPDKYTRDYNGGEFSKVIRTNSSHWRYTVSTCMTFGVKVKTLREDNEVWQKFIDGQHPHDHQIFTALGKKNRRLAVCIPGAACHTDLEFSARMNKMSMEPWAIEMMTELKYDQLLDIEVNLAQDTCSDALDVFQELIADVILRKVGLERLLAYDALCMQYSKSLVKE